MAQPTRQRTAMHMANRYRREKFPTLAAINIGQSSQLDQHGMAGSFGCVMQQGELHGKKEWL